MDRGQLLNILQFTRANTTSKIYWVQNIHSTKPKKSPIGRKACHHKPPLHLEMRSLVSLNLIRLEKTQILPVTYQLHEGVSIIMENWKTGTTAENIFYTQLLTPPLPSPLEIWGNLHKNSFENWAYLFFLHRQHESSFLYIKHLSFPLY